MKKREVITMKPMMILPPAADKCQVCATKHEPELPHNQQSLFYQMKFQMEHGRGPTWADAMEHCDEAMRKYWIEKLSEAGVKVGIA